MLCSSDTLNAKKNHFRFKNERMKDHGSENLSFFVMEGQENKCLLDNTEHNTNNKLRYCNGMALSWLSVICGVTSIACLQATKDLPPIFQMNTVR